MKKIGKFFEKILSFIIIGFLIILAIGLVQNGIIRLSYKKFDIKSMDNNGVYNCSVSDSGLNISIECNDYHNSSYAKDKVDYGVKVTPKENCDQFLNVSIQIQITANGEIRTVDIPVDSYGQASEYGQVLLSKADYDIKVDAKVINVTGTYNYIQGLEATKVGEYHYYLKYNGIQYNANKISKDAEVVLRNGFSAALEESYVIGLVNMKWGKTLYFTGHIATKSGYEIPYYGTNIFFNYENPDWVGSPCKKVQNIVFDGVFSIYNLGQEYNIGTERYKAASINRTYPNLKNIYFSDLSAGSSSMYSTTYDYLMNNTTNLSLPTSGVNFYVKDEYVEAFSHYLGSTKFVNGVYPTSSYTGKITGKNTKFIF